MARINHRAWGGHVRWSKEVHRFSNTNACIVDFHRGRTPVIPVIGRAGVNGDNIHQNGKGFIKIRLELSDYALNA